MKSLTTQTLKIFWQHAKKYPWHVFFIAFGVVGHVILQNYSPLLYKKLIDTAVSGGPQNSGAMLTVVKTILFVAIARFTFARGFNYINNYFQPKVMADLNNTAFGYLQKHSYGFFGNSFIGSLVTKVKRYERAFEQISDQIVFEMGRTFLDTVFILTVLFTQNKTIGLMSLAWAVFYIVFSYIFSQYKLPTDLKRAEADSEVTAQLADTLTNNFNVKTFSAYDRENTEFSHLAQKQFKIRKKSWDLGTTSEVVQAATMIALEIAVMYAAVKYWQAGVLSIGTLALLQSYFYRLFDKFWNVGKHIRSTYEALADANEMTEILLTPHEVKDTKNAKNFIPGNGLIEFKNLEFGYTKSQTLFKNFNLSIKPKQKIALVGPSGGGKSTIIKLLLRLYDINSGQILLDGQDIANLSQDSVRASIAFVSQDPILFHRSLMENIRYGSPQATDELVVQAAKLANAHEFISSFMDGYNTLVGERGVKLSGGERQRVAIARAILKNAPILILDEATSSLDSENEFLIQQALARLMQDKTVVVIAHRLSTIMKMDRIAVLEAGHIVEEGRHDELLKANQGIYQRLWKIQAGGFA